MSWLSGGLNQFSNITGQITSFTKEVLTETTEEVTDPTAELEVLRQKHDEQVRSYQYLQSECVKVKEHSTEMVDRAETAEYQISTISQEYRKLLEDRDGEIRRLKTEAERLKDQAKGHLYSLNPHSPLKELAQFQLGVMTSESHSEVGALGGGEYESVDIGGSGEDWAGHYNHDFGDVISSQSEINRLQSELSKVRLELQHWRTIATEKNNIMATVETSHHTSDKLSLNKEQEDRHHQELASLQASHQQRLHSLSERHQQEIGQLQEQIDTLIGKMKVQQHSVRAEPEWHRTRELEDLNSSLLSQLNQLKTEYRKGQLNNTKLVEKLEMEQASTLRLTTEIKSLTDQLHQEKLSQDHSLKQDKERLEVRLKEMQAMISDHQSDMDILQKNHSKSIGNSNDLQLQIEILNNKLSKKDRDIDILKRELQVHEERFQHGMVEGDDLFEQKLREVEEKAKDTERQLCSVEEELKLVKIREEALKVKCSDMEVSLAKEREVFRTELSGSKPRSRNTQAENDAAQLMSELNYYKKSFEDKIIELNNAEAARSSVAVLLCSKEEEVKSLSDNLDKIKQSSMQNEEMMSKLHADHNDALKQIQIQGVEVVSFLAGKSELEGKLQEEKLRNEERTEKLMVLQRENSEYSKQLANLKAHLIQVKEHYGQEATKAGQREAGLKQHQDNLQEKEQRYEQVLAMEGELKVLREERNAILLNMKTAEERAEDSSESLKNLQSVLEQFQKDQNQALHRSQLELTSAMTECQHLKVEGKSLQAQLDEAWEAAEVASVLNQELEEKEAKMASLSQEIKELQVSLEDKQHRITSLAHQDKEVDRSLVKNLVLGYVHASQHKKIEVLQLIAKILEFTPEELEQAVGGPSRAGSWLSGLWRAPSSPTLQPQSPSSLSRLFIKFLESESSPKSLTTQSPDVTTNTVSGYIDPLTDPDRPSLSTASLLGSLSQKVPEKSRDITKDNQVMKKKVTEVERDTNQPVSLLQARTQDVLSSQSSLLKNVLSDS